MDVSLQGRVVVVTGGGSGLGEAYARHLSARGAAVVVNDIGHDGPDWSADRVTAAIRSGGGRAVADRNTVATPDGGEAIVRTALDEFGGIDVVIANAGIVRRGPFDELSVDDVRQVLAVNLEGAFWVTRAAFPHLKAQRRGRIVLVTSSAGFYGHGVGANYCASKGGIFGLLRALSIEGPSHGVLVNAVSPFASTAMSEGLVPAPVAARLDPSHVAAVVVYLASDECTVNGLVLTVAGGTVARTFSVTTQGWRVPPGATSTPESVRDHLEQIVALEGVAAPGSVAEELRHLLGAPIKLEVDEDRAGGRRG